MRESDYPEGTFRVQKLTPHMAYNAGLYAPQMVLLPASADPSLAETLAPDDWYKANGGPCLILGEATLGGDGKLHPLGAYDLKEALRVTAIYRGSQREAEEKERRRQEAATRKERTAQEAYERHVRAVEAQRLNEERARQAALFDPVKEIERLKERLNRVEGQSPTVNAP